MKRILTVLLFSLFALFLVSCNGERDNRTKITYAAWNLGPESLNNLERRMIKAYEEYNPDVKVEIVERQKIVDEDGVERESDWDSFLNAQAAIKEMPDVFQIDNVVKAILNDWATDVSEIANSDEEFNKIPLDIREAAAYNNKLFALPQAMFYFGYFINRTLISQNVTSNDDIPTYGVSYEKLLEIASKSSKAAVQGGDGIIGIDGMNELSYWLAAQYDDSLGWYTYNEDGYHLDSDAFKLAIYEQKKYFTEPASYASYVLESANARFLITEDESQNPQTMYGDGVLFTTGHQAIKWEGSYNLRNWLAATEDPESEMPGLFQADIDFIGTPSVTVDGKTNHRVPVVLDYIAIGKGTKHLEEAYDFAKWMSFGIDGYKKRLEIAREHPKSGAINFAPIVQDEDLLTEYFELYPTLVEFKKLVTSHTDYIVESLAKTVPGYVESRWTGKYDETTTVAVVLDNIRDGKTNYDDVAVNLNNLINQIYQDAKEQLEDALNSD